MKVLYISSDTGIPVLGKKGAAVHVRELIAALGRSGHFVLLAASELNRPWETPEKLEGMLLSPQVKIDSNAVISPLNEFNETLGVNNALPGHIRRILYNQELLRQLKRKFKKHAPDFIYERASLYATAGVLLAQGLNRPLLIELNAPLAEEQSRYRTAGLGELAAQAERWTLSQADAVLVVSSQLRDYVLSLGIEANKVHIFPNGVNTNLFKPGLDNPEIRKRWKLGNGPILGFVGGLRPWHGVKALPALMECLVKRNKEVKLVIVGEGPLYKELKSDFEQRKLSQNAVFTGILPHGEVAAIIPQFDIALAPYPQLDHSFYFSPLKLFEYMACGVPVVASEVGQIAEIIANDKDGLLYPPDDLDALTAACDRLLSDSALRTKIGQAAAEKIHNRYTWDHNAKRVTELAQSLIAAKITS